jgi:predicted amidohydrolase YtcJ
VLLKHNLFEIPQESISTTPVLMTVVNGQVVHRQ